MSGKAYDDTRLIAEIEGLMRRQPHLSQRAAILQVAGEDSLRRLQAKMARTPMSMPVAAGNDLRIALGTNEVERTLLTVERETLAGTGETVQWAEFSDIAALRRRKLARLLRGRPDLERLFPIVAVLGIFVLLVVLATGMGGAKGYEVPLADHPNLLTALMLIGTMLLIGGASAHIHCGEVTSSVTEHDTLRATLTDRALYLFEAKGGTATIRRIARTEIVSIRLADDGDAVVELGGGSVAMPCPRQPAGLMARLGATSNSPAPAGALPA